MYINLGYLFVIAKKKLHKNHIVKKYLTNNQTIFYRVKALNILFYHTNEQIM